ncbi:MAG: hypothetical protein J6S87_03895 [Bacteroidales bacterium]|nr:hypothetical protein [Bacteroidales bacterium]
MYNVELKNITLETAQTDVLQVVENICDQFRMENHFGTISTALHEMLSLMERFSEDADAPFSINFFVEAEKVSVQVLNYRQWEDVQRALETCSVNDADATAFTAKTLLDVVEFRDNGIWMEIAAYATENQPDRAQILHTETVKAATVHKINNEN